MKLRSGWMLLAAALPLVSMQMSCGQSSESSPQEVSAAGTLRVRLTGESAEGHIYRLREADLEITGPTNVTLHTEDDPDAEVLRHDLQVGAYELLLKDGWFLEKQTDDGTFVPVEAVLTSQNPAPFATAAQETTGVTLRFRAGQEIIELEDGELEVYIEVEEEQCGKLQTIVTLPSSVEAIQRLDSDPDTLLVATRGAAIWRIELDHYTGEANDVSLQQSLDLIQSTTGAFFESADGTLFTGGGYEGSTPPYYSTDHGNSFQPATSGDYPPDATFVYAELNGVVYAGTGQGENIGPYPAAVHRYDGEGSWSHVFSVPPPHNRIQAMAVHQGQLFVGAAIREDPVECVDDASPVYVSSDGESFTPTLGFSCAGSVKALASNGDQLLALMDGFHMEGGTVLAWDPTRERFSDLPNHPFDVRTVDQHRFVVRDGVCYAAAFLEGDWDGGIYRSEDGVSWTPIVEQEELILYALNVEADPLYAAAGGTIFSVYPCR